MKLSCIIPAYNEAPRIGAVLKTALAHPMINEVIVVDDGSTDRTCEIACSVPGAQVIRLQENRGKTCAVVNGLRRATGSHVLLLDSDLVGLGAGDLDRLIAPVASGHADVAISLRRNAPMLWHFLGIDYISGERIMPFAILSGHLDTMEALPRFGLEVFLNRLWIGQELTISVAQWPAVSSPHKSAKRGGNWLGIRADLAMLRDIFRTVSPFEAAVQIHALRKGAR